MLTQQLRRKATSEEGFTLLEILVVVAIMGFLIAMVAPRFAGIVGGTEEVVCDSNQQRLVTALSTFNETRNGNFPNGLVNLVDTNDAVASNLFAHYRVPTTTRTTDPNVGPATFSKDFDEHHWFQIHILNDAEANELRSLGITTLYNLNAYDYDALDCGLDRVECTDGVPENYETEAYREGRGNVEGRMTPVDSDDRGDFMARVSVQGGLGVLMAGMGAIDDDADIVNFGGITAPEEHTRADHFGRYDTPGRIVLGVGPENTLITEGMITTAGLCPAGISGDRFTWNNYSIVLPRLSATVDRYAVSDPEAEATTDFAVFMRSVSARADEGKGVIREGINLTTTQAWNFYTACPEGHSWPETDELDDWVFYTAAEWPED
ncbi:type II secretion system protein [Desulfobulbus alkaliphilus]|uniref:type II secretion system protein n=1 Tax=Desulfobulbus alkaliphilus TaxID=869814 RepID=UPI001966ACA7|nr:prepilin-type N-terminal cleavage/methylation domain-containing protein [Desulfobulbus alkaliphilus]MBM9536586.1 prepilin-type N-terminal cleavage/methylation domain-containing protein [Desulfobulbus alkaliphilus]